MKLKLSLLMAFGLVMSVAQATVHQVTVGSNFFNPAALTIMQGDTVEWTNTGGAHNVNGTLVTFPSNPVSFGNSVGSGWTYDFQFNVPGTYQYQCDPHQASMQGTITVTAAPVSSDLIITGVYDADLSGGTPKGVELFATQAISDLSIYGLESANNGGGAVGPEFTFPSVSVAANTYIYVSSEATEFTNFFGFAPDYTTNAMGINGDDAVALYQNGVMADVFGDVNTDGTGQPWEYLDSWAYRVPGTGPDGSTYTAANWTFGLPNALDGETSNATALTPVPIQTYFTGGGVINVPGYPVATIDEITTNDAAFVPDSLNAMVEVSGTVYTIDFDGNAGYSFYIYDNTGGVNVFSFSDVDSYVPAIGDSISIWGSVAQFRGLTELEPDSILLQSSGNILKAPMLVTDLDESTEGEYIKLNGVWVVDPADWPTAGNDANVDITNGVDTFTMRIVSETDIDGSPVPTAPFNVEGAGSQFTFSTPANDGYQIFPVSLSSFTTITASTLPYYTIAQATTSDATTGVADSLAVEMELRGTVYTIDFDGNNGYSFYMYDGTGGINVFNFNDVSGYNVQVGDSISVFGEIDQYNGLTEIVADSIVRWSAGNSLMAPMVVSNLDESTEGEYIRIDSVMLVDPTQWPASGSANVDIYTPANDTLTMRIDSDTDIPGTLAPAGMFYVIGAGSQFDGSSPYDEGYQLYPISRSHIVEYPPAVPTINFESSIMSISEAAGTVTVNLVINPTASTAETVDLQFAYGVGLDINDGTVNPLPDLVTGILTLNVPANEDTISFDLTVIDDAVIEGNETLFVDIATLSSGLQMGTVSQFEIVVIDNDGLTPTIPTYDIATATTIDGVGEPDSLGVEMKLHGVVTSDDFDGNAGLSFYIQDATDGVSIFNSQDVDSYSVQRGDSLRVVGEIGFYNGLTQLVVDSISILSTGAALPQPEQVSMLDETTESNLVELNYWWFVDPSAWNGSGSSFNIDITNGTDTFAMRVDGDIDLASMPLPAQGAFHVTGIGNQFDNTSPYFENYQIFPRDAADIVAVPDYTIDQVTTVDADSYPDSIGADVTVYGVVYTDNFQGGGLSFYIYDNTGGVNVFNFDPVSGYVPTRGDSVMVSGEVDFYNGLIEIIPGAIQVLDQGITLKQPALVSELGESTEGEYIRMEGWWFVDTTAWDGTGGSFNMDITNGTDTFIMRIDSDIDLASMPIPTTGTFNVIGAGGQFDNSSPYDEGYQIFPRDASDIIPTVSLDEFEVFDVAIFPNPAQNVVYIQTADNKQKTVEVFTMTGQPVRRMESTATKVEVNLEGLPRGAYIISVKAEGEMASRKVILE